MCRLFLAFLISVPSLCYGQTVFDSRTQKMKQADYYFQTAEQYFRQKKYTTATSYYDSAIALFPRNTRYYFNRAEAKKSGRNYVGALADLETVIALDPDFMEAYFLRGVMYHILKRYEVAVADFSFILDQKGRRETTTIVFKGLQAGEEQEATFSGISTLDDMDADVYMARAQAYAALGNMESALQDFESALGEKGDNPSVLVNRGLFYLQQADTSSAKADFRAALINQPGFQPAVYNLARISTPEERRQLDKVLYADNEASVVFAERAYNKFLNADYKGALADYDSALFWRPAHADYLMNRGMVKARLKRYHDALKDYQASHDEDRTLIKNYYLIGNAYQQLKQYKRAIAYYDSYLLEAGPDAQVYYNRGVAVLKTGNKKEACENLTRALELGEERAKKPKMSACK